MSFHKVITGDCLEVLRTLDAGSIDAVVTDPPYCSGSVGEAQRVAASGQGLRSETVRRLGWFTGDNMGTAGLCWLLRTLAVESRAVVKQTGSFLCFCDWRMVSSIQPAIESAGLRFQSMIVWDKGHMGLGAGFRNQHELVLHFTYGSPDYHNLGTSNVLRAARVTADDREHQTQKPVELLCQLIRVVCPEGGMVLDPFCGSGTTLVAAKQTGRSALGIEIDEGYANIARRRIADAASLFHQPEREADPLLIGATP